LDEPSRSVPVIDPRYIVNVLIELQVAVRKLALYSFSHTIVPTLLENLEKQFYALFEFVEEVTFGITRNELLYQGTTLSAANPVIRELARGLNQFGLAGMTFSKGLTKAEILQFLRFLIEGRGRSPEQKERMLDQLNQEFPSIRVKFIRFGEALKSLPDTDDPDHRGTTGREGKELWRGLVRQLMEESPETDRQNSGGDAEEYGDPNNIAELVNRLCRGSGPGSQSYERTIVRYMSKQAENRDLTEEQRIHLNREMSRLLSNLEPDVREQIFRISMEETQDGEAPIEGVLDFLPEPTLMEVLNQIQVSDQNISAPMLSLLNKFTDLSAKNGVLEKVLASKLGDHQDLFQELLTYRANRVYYPTSYRLLLDQELTHQPIGKKPSPSPEIGAIDPGEVNHHLALVVMELLDVPVRSQAEYGALLQQMNRLLTEGLDDRTHAMLQETLMLLVRKMASAEPEARSFLQKEIKNFINPEVLSRLLQTYRAQGDENIGDLFGRMRELAGVEIIPIFLDLLETEENLSVRKRLLEWIVQCGPEVIPLAVQRLKSPKWYVVRNMLVLLKDLRAKEALPDIARCLRQDSPKLKMAALQAIEAVGKGTDSFYQALAIALRDPDPAVFCKAASMMVSYRDPRALGMIAAQLHSSSLSKNVENLLTVLETIRKSGAAELIPVLVKMRRQLRLRFWQWNRTRAVYRAVNDAVQELHARTKKHV
jgi:HEAT repeats